MDDPPEQERNLCLRTSAFIPPDTMGVVWDYTFPFCDRDVVHPYICLQNDGDSLDSHFTFLLLKLMVPAWMPLAPVKREISVYKYACIRLFVRAALRNIMTGGMLK